MNDPAHRSFLDAGSPRLPNGPLVKIMRVWLPLLLCTLGVLMLIVNLDGFGVDAFATFVGAGSSIWLINFLWRLGISGDDERELEAVDRAYLARHGHWPDEADRHAATPASGPDRPSGTGTPADRDRSRP